MQQSILMVDSFKQLQHQHSLQLLKTQLFAQYKGVHYYLVTYHQIHTQFTKKITFLTLILISIIVLLQAYLYS